MFGIERYDKNNITTATIVKKILLLRASFSKFSNFNLFKFFFSIFICIILSLSNGYNNWFTLLRKGKYKKEKIRNANRVNKIVLFKS